MTSARASQINLNTTTFYHCMTHCIPGTFLWGPDRYHNRDYTHRKNWIVARIKKLAEVFAIKVCAYAVMSNHYHLILRVNIDEANTWDRYEIKSRWARIFPRDAMVWDKKGFLEPDTQNQLMKWRNRLMDISWFMRCLNEHIAKLSHRENGTGGKFWQGRFKSKALLKNWSTLNNLTQVDLSFSQSTLWEISENPPLPLIEQHNRIYMPKVDDFLVRQPAVKQQEGAIFAK